MLEGNMMIRRLEGHEAIDVAEAFGQPLCKYADPVEGARTDLTVAEAREVAREDPRLVYLDVAAMDHEDLVLANLALIEMLLAD
jgi:hypothetical protein